MLKEKVDLVNEIKEFITDVSTNKDAVKEIKVELAKNGITGGWVEKILSEPEELNEVDQRELALLTQQFFVNTGIQTLNPEHWFTEHEMKTARLYDKRVFDEVDLDMEIVFEDVTMVDDKVYLTTIDIAKITELMDSQALYYDFNIQRQAKRKKDGINKKATVYRKNVKEIKDKLLKRKLKPTTIVFNALVGSGDADEELDYDASTRTLKVAPGVRLAILDGYHRCLGSKDALKANPDLNFKFLLELTNYTTKEAQEFQADHAKATPIPKTRIQMFEQSRHADAVTQSLMSDSELADRIAEQHRISPSTGELVSYNVLTDAIEREFPMEFRRDTVKVAEYLREFFDELIPEYAEEFLNNKANGDSLMSYNKMFAGYIALASKMQKEEIPISELKSILDNVDFSRDNSEWEDLGVLNKDKKISNRADEKKIANYFKKLV